MARRKKPKSKKKKKILPYMTRFEAIKPYVDFKYDKRKGATDYEKRKIKKYYDILKPKIAETTFSYSPRTKENIRNTRKVTGINLRGMKSFPIAAPEGMKTKVSFTKGGALKVNHSHGSFYFIEFDPKELFKDAEKHIRDLQAEYEIPEEATFRLKMGEHLQSKAPETLTKLIGIVEYILSMLYDDTEVWLRGFEVHDFKDLKTLSEFHTERRGQTVTQQQKIKNVQKKVNAEKKRLKLENLKGKKKR